MVVAKFNARSPSRILRTTPTGSLRRTHDASTVGSSPFFSALIVIRLFFMLNAACSTPRIVHSVRLLHQRVLRHVLFGQPVQSHRRSVGTTGALVSAGSSRLRAIACFIISCWYSRFDCDATNACLSVATAAS